MAQLTKIVLNGMKSTTNNNINNYILISYIKYYTYFNILLFFTYKNVDAICNFAIFASIIFCRLKEKS